MYRILRGSAFSNGQDGMSPFTIKKTKTGAKLRVNTSSDTVTLKFSEEDISALLELLQFYNSYKGDLSIIVSDNSINDIDVTFNEYSFFSPYI